MLNDLGGTAEMACCGELFCHFNLSRLSAFVPERLASSSDVREIDYGGVEGWKHHSTVRGAHFISNKAHAWRRYENA